MPNAIEKLINRIRAIPSGVDPSEVFENLKKDYPELTKDIFFLAWKAAELL